MKKRMLALLLAAMLVLSLMSACGSGAETPTEAPATEEPAAPEAAAPPAEEEPEAEPEEVPDGPVAGDKDFDWSVFEPLVDEPTTLTMFYTQPPMLASIMESPNDMSILYQTFEEITNVEIEFRMVNMAGADTTFQLMIASNDYCDITNDALNYYDAADQAYEDGLAVNLLDYAECVPNYLALMDEYPQIRADLTTLEGRILNFSRVDMPVGQVADAGLLIRKDWLDNLNMDVPQSYDEMHDVLAAFKSEYDVSDPYIMPYQVLSPWGLMAGGYGLELRAGGNNFYVDLDTNEVKLGTISDAYYDYLSMFRDWYAEGLINSDFISKMENLPDQSIIATENAGVWFSDIPYITNYTNLLTEVNPNAELALMGDPGIDDARTGYIESIATVANSGGFSVSESSEHVELALRWCDMWYDPALTQFINYGNEGETFEYDKNGKPVLSGIILNNDLELPSMRMTNGVYLCTSGGFIYDLHKYDLEYSDMQISAYTDWLVEADDPSTVKTSTVPGGAKLTVDEAETVSVTMGDIQTLVSEMALKFVTGDVELNEESYAKYVSDVEALRLQDAIDAMQSAYDRYLENKG